MLGASLAELFPCIIVVFIIIIIISVQREDILTHLCRMFSTILFMSTKWTTLNSALLPLI